ncbi:MULTISPECIES: hypothetical protein [unclassified Streptomyces]|uniref:hypothetical protein n=1 Tax=unclassified Streptomyces TaxID=2593676 RepID=UPI002DDA6E5F|nr:hypothetical protein [Streptomyces sp. NBC_01750]WSB01444.1 hypothetical protein OIE54_20330 [Streptomyces sp. NBC_01794]WSD34227.1 hypothetical protein OG966_21440 [Streptomyces sp. NBC_01750]
MDQDFPVEPPPDDGVERIGHGPLTELVVHFDGSEFLEAACEFTGFVEVDTSGGAQGDRVRAE